MEITAFQIAQRFVGTREVPGSGDNPHVLAMLRLDAKWPEGDEVPWCSAFVNYVAWLLRLPRSKSLRARSWLEIGAAVQPARALVGFDVAIFSRPPQPLAGHVGFFAGWDSDVAEDDHVLLLGGNQRNSVSIRAYPRERLLGIRRLT